MLRGSFKLLLLLAALGVVENAQGQSRITGIEPAVRPQLELEADQEVDDLELLGKNDRTDDSPDDDLESKSESSSESDLASDLDGTEESITPQRLSDNQLRQNWLSHSMPTISLGLVESGRVPDDRSELLNGFGRVGPVSDSVKVFGWEAPSIRHQPLYFEDVVLERYGQTLPDYRQSIRSAIRFGTAMTGLAFQMHETPPRSCDSPLGYCRPGACVAQTTQRHFFGALSLR